MSREGRLFTEGSGKMKLKAVSGIMLTLLLVGMLTLTFNIQPVKASGTIRIRADGSIEGTTDISTVDNVTYTFTDNIFNQSIVVERDNIVVDGADYTLQGTGSGAGITLSGRSNITIKNIEIRAFHYGIFLLKSSNNIISGNKITNNSIVGIRFDSSPNNIISGNNITKNNQDGIDLHDSDYNSICGNNITANERDGIGLYSSDYNNMSGNTITNIVHGIFLSVSRINRITGNNIRNNKDGIWFFESFPNFVYHNNFVNNTIQAVILPGIIDWDDGYPSGGNFWSDHVDVDVKSGSNQDQPGSDGISDTPYIIYADNEDRYPLTYPWGASPPPSYTLTIYSSPTEVTFTVDYVSRTAPWSGTYSEGASVRLVMPETYGEYIWSHWLEDGGTNRTRTIVLTGNTSWTGVFRIQGDVNGDGIVDIGDISLCALAFGSMPEEPRWNPIVDCNQDCIIDIFDLVMIGIHFGETS